MKAHGAKVKIKRTTNEKEVFDVFDVFDVGNFSLPMLVLSTIIKVISFQTPIAKQVPPWGIEGANKHLFFYLLLHP